MTQEEKQLLLKDLCARLLYKPHVRIKDGKVDVAIDIVLNGTYIHDWITVPSCQNMTIKPYLRPMSSMTEDEKDELYDWGWVYGENNIYSDGSSDANNVYQNYQKDIQDVKWLIDWLSSHHFDYRGLIPMGLALEAPADMYKN